MEFRKDRDSMGEILVPREALYGPQTERSKINFAIGSEQMPKNLIRAYALIKQAAAEANMALGLLPKEKAELIIDAAEEIIEGKHNKEFPLKVWQTGSGTQTNMNLNEVIANIANKKMGKQLGANSPIHPNDHVNMSQSTNDSFPTAMHVAAVIEINHHLLPSLDNLTKTFAKKSFEFRDIVKMGRTHLQDATPLTLGQEIGGYASQLSACKTWIISGLSGLYELALGGTAVGTGLNCPRGYDKLVASIIAKKTDLAFVTSPDKFSALASHDACAQMSGSLNTLAAACMKIANDIRLMASGPRGGLYEIFIAENEPGSSIMPGKVNPTQCEALTMVAAQVMGNHVAITIACSQGHFELNVYKPVIIKNLLNSIEILSDAMHSFDIHCAQTIKPNHHRLDELKNRSLMLVTALTPFIGYDQAAKIAKEAHEQHKTLKEVVLEHHLMSEAEFDERCDPKKMLSPL